MSINKHTTITKPNHESRADRNIRWGASTTVILLAVSAGVLSYDSLRKLAIQSKVNPELAFLFPITVDGLILSGSLLLLFFAIKGKGSLYGLFLTALGVIASIAGNVAVSPDDIASRLVHGTAPVVLFLSLEALTILLRWKSKVNDEAELALEAKAAAETLLSISNTETNLISAEIEEPKPDVFIAVSPQTFLPGITSHPVLDVNPAVVQQDTKTGDEEDFTTLAMRRILEEPAKKPSVSAKAVISVAKSENTTFSPRTTREQITDLIAENSSITVDEIADLVDGERKYVRKLAREELTKI